ncbi:membrane protein [Streptomyces capoamus]|uniref:Membrane protein n=3 Tax=Streptomyces TaxID=1883 RepID=A0A919EUE3_9ACTN|nr:membrane protein [Streptomyces libani subsp. rufus]GHG38733.1 membrane protein [Streptomyces capoamus]
MAAPLQLTRMHRVLIGVVVTGALIIAGIGFAGSYAAVRELAIKKGFGNFSYVFPVGIDAGICVLLALDLLLTWIRIPFPLLRQTAWLLTAATIAFNGAAAWPDPLGVGMHAVIPILFVVSVEAARHAVGRIADITADKHMEGVRLTRWLLSPVPTFLLWRRMKLWELRSYDQVIKLEQERLVYQARLRSRFGRAWRRKAPVESLMPLRLARYGVPLAETAPAGLAAAGIEPALLPPVVRQPQPVTAGAAVAGAPAAAADGARAAGTAPVPGRAAPAGGQRPEEPAADEQSPWFQAPKEIEYHGGYDPTYDPMMQEPQYAPEEEYGDWYEEQPPGQFQQPSPEETGSFPIPVGPNRTRELGDGGGVPQPDPTEEDYYQVFRKSIDGSLPTPHQFGEAVEATFGLTVPARDAERMVNRFTNRFNAELEEDHIA